MTDEPGRPSAGGHTRNKPLHDIRHFRVGDRVSRKDGTELGTVVEAEGQTKVKWDSGATSYFRNNSSTDIKRL